MNVFILIIFIAADYVILTIFDKHRNKMD